MKTILSTTTAAALVLALAFPAAANGLFGPSANAGAIASANQQQGQAQGQLQGQGQL
jgi:hypothetical protein